MSNMPDYKVFLKEVISLLRDNIIDLKEKKMFADENERDYIEARLFSYKEIILSVKFQLKEHHISESEIGLDKLEDVL